MNTTHTNHTAPHGGRHLAFPKGFIAVRILQIVFAFLVLALTAFLLSRNNGVYFSSEGMAIFTSLAAIIIAFYALFAERIFGDVRENLFALLALEIFIVIFWLATMGSLASLRTSFNVPIIIDKRYITYYTYATDGYLGSLAGDAVISGFSVIIWAVSLFFVAKAFHVYRITHLTGASNTTTTTTTGGTQLNNVDPEKHAATATTTPVAAYHQPSPAATPYQQTQQQQHPTPSNTTAAAPSYSQDPAAPTYQHQQPVPATPAPTTTTYESTSATLNSPYDSYSHGPEVVPHQYTTPPPGMSEVSGTRA